MMLSIGNLRVAYNGQAPIAEGWSACIGAGVTWVRGDTGSGKSTLMRVLAGRSNAYCGDLLLAGVRLGDDEEAYRRDVFFCEPATELYDQMTVRDAADALVSGPHGLDERRWLELVQGFSLAPHLEKCLYMLSTGTKRKVFLAAALASRCPLVLLDEPTGALDARSIACLWNAISAISQHAEQAVVVASGEPLGGVPLAAIIDLPMVQRA